MILFTILLVALGLEVITSVCPDEFVVKNVNWNNVAAGSFLHDVACLEKMNGKRLWIHEFEIDFLTLVL